MKHDLIKTGDPDVFYQIKDRNGEVALDFCRVCRRGEGELAPECPGFARLTVPDRHESSSGASEIVTRYVDERTSCAVDTQDMPLPGDANAPSAIPAQCDCALCVAARHFADGHQKSVDAAFVDGVHAGRVELAAELTALLAKETYEDYGGERALVDEAAKLIAQNVAATPILERLVVKLSDIGYRRGHNARGKSLREHLAKVAKES